MKGDALFDVTRAGMVLHPQTPKGAQWIAKCLTTNVTDIHYETPKSPEEGWRRGEEVMDAMRKDGLAVYYGVHEYNVVDGTHYDPRTPQAVVNVLERCRKNNTRSRLRLGDKWTGRDWLEEYDVEGTIGRSMGPVKVPLLISNIRSSGGPAILDYCMVRIVTSHNGHVLYSHPQYHRGEFKSFPGDMPGYEAVVTVDGEIHARFKTQRGAERWVKRMSM